MEILMVDDEPTHLLMLTKMCELMGHRVTTAQNGEEGLLYLKQANASKYDMVLTDLFMPVMGGRQFVPAARASHPNLPIIVLTSESSDAVADELKALGAQDFLTKPVSKSRLKVSIENALQLMTLQQEVQRLNSREASNGFGFDSLIGAYSGLEESVRLARKYARSDMPVLLTGESGVGKEVFAHAIHGESHRAAQPFIAINCGAIPPNLVESTLFGHEKGSFTGAIDRSLGKFREAQGGTLFLDEIGELPLDMQVKLLRALQQAEVEPVGLGKAVKIDVRIISATNQSLERMVQEATFRSDLFFRLAVLPLELPPLRERQEDIAALCEYFLVRSCAREGVPPKQLDASAISWAASHDWPGNVRELENTISRAVLLSEADEISRAELEPVAKGQVMTPKAALPESQTSAFDHTDGSPKTLEELTIELAQWRLEQANGQMSEAAHALGMPVSTLYRKQREWRDAGKWPEE
jgi:DNA-binding NtrC family response regulator